MASAKNSDVHEVGRSNPSSIVATDDAPVSPAATFAAAAGDNFAGTDRKAAKLAISNAATQSFTNIKDLIGTLVPEANMIKHGRYTILETDQMVPYDDPKPKVGPSNRSKSGSK